jgi:molybdenum cofactor biosynthesis enzyme MoaA
MINKKCNIKCIFCYHNWFKEVTDSYKFEDFSKLLYLWSEKWITELYISWWEPTISNDLQSVLSLAKKLWYEKMKLMTNWLAFSDMGFCIKMKKLWVTDLAISMHWYNEASFEFHAWVRWIYKKFITWLVNSQKFFHVQINVVITKHNISWLATFWNLLKKMWLKHIHLQHIVPNSEISKELLPDENIAEECINRFLDEFSDKLDITLEFFPYCLIKREHSQNLWKFSYLNDFITNDPEMFDEWSDWIAENKKKRDKCLTCPDVDFCLWFWNQ